MSLDPSRRRRLTRRMHRTWYRSRQHRNLLNYRVRYHAGDARSVMPPRITLFRIHLPTWRSSLMIGALLLIPTFASAHGEQIVVFPISLGMLLVPAIAIVAVRWHPKWYARLLTALALLVSNVALWFSPAFPTTIGELAAYDLRKAMAILLITPLVVAIGVGIVLKRVLGGRAA